VTRTAAPIADQLGESGIVSVVYTTLTTPDDASRRKRGR
jgi:hypothetical protein